MALRACTGFLTAPRMVCALVWQVFKVPTPGPRSGPSGVWRASQRNCPHTMAEGGQELECPFHFASFSLPGIAQARDSQAMHHACAHSLWGYAAVPVPVKVPSQQRQHNSESTLSSLCRGTVRAHSTSSHRVELVSKLGMAARTQGCSPWAATAEACKAHQSASIVPPVRLPSGCLAPEPPTSSSQHRG